MALDLLSECRKRIVLGDGAMGTELQRAGLQPGHSGESWNLEHPDEISAIHRRYVEAGSEIVISNSFGANPWVLSRYGLEAQLPAINRAAASIARQAAGPDVLVLGDIGPFGGFLSPLGDVAPDEVLDAFTRQAAALLESGADGIMIETMSAIEEILLAVKAARVAGAPLVVASMAFDHLQGGAFRTMMGVGPGEAAMALSDAGADIIGANCGTRMTPGDFAKLAAAFRQAVGVPLMIQPNAGQPELHGGHVVYRLAAEAFADEMREVVNGGARIVGGCCGTTPAHIAALAAVLRQM
jgi:5-methyltetrahydrofolate--homocysteine methyltransferase